MKRFLSLLAAVPLAALMLASCGDQPCPECPEPPRPPITDPSSVDLPGTWWSAVSSWGDSHTLDFAAAPESPSEKPVATYTYRARGGYTFIVEGTYTYDPPAIHITGNQRWGNPVEMAGTVDAQAGMITLGAIDWFDPRAPYSDPLDPAAPVGMYLGDRPTLELPAEPTFVGEWRLAASAWVPAGEEPEMITHGGRTIYNFMPDGKGWVYQGHNSHQESFAWRRRGPDRLIVNGWRLETWDEIIFEPSGYISSEEWTVLGHTVSEFSVTFRSVMSPDWVGEDHVHLYPDHDTYYTFERVK